MRTIMLLAIFFANFSAHADFIRCSQSLRQNPQMVQALDFLQSIQGSYQIGRCSVELHVCSEFAADDSPGSLVGDLLIIDRSGRRSYMQFDFPTTSSAQSPIEILNGKIVFHYEFDDHHPDRVFGRRESIRVEFLKSENHRDLLSLEEGWYTSTDRQTRRRGSVYNWTLCHRDVKLREFTK